MWNSRKITKRWHFCWTLTVNSSTGSEPQHIPNRAHPKHSKPTPCYSCCASATVIRKLRQLNPPALTVSFVSSPGVSSLSQEISLELNPRRLSSNPQGFHKEWDICLASLDDLLGSINCSLALSYTQSQGVWHGNLWKTKVSVRTVFPTLFQQAYIRKIRKHQVSQLAKRSHSNKYLILSTQRN